MKIYDKFFSEFVYNKFNFCYLPDSHICLDKTLFDKNLTKVYRRYKLVSQKAVCRYVCSCVAINSIKIRISKYYVWVIMLTNIDQMRLSRVEMTF